MVGLGAVKNKRQAFGRQLSTCKEGLAPAYWCPGTVNWDRLQGVRNRRGWLKLKAEGGGGSHLPGDRTRMRLDGNLRLVEMTEDNRTGAEVSIREKFGHLSGDMKTVYNCHCYAPILTLCSWFHLHKETLQEGERCFYVNHNGNFILIMLFFS